MGFFGVRWRALFLAAGVGVFGLPVLGAPVVSAAVSVPDQAQDEATATAWAREAGKQILVTSKTTETSQTVANPNGSWTLTEYTHPVRVKHGPDWTPIDTTLVRNADGSVTPKATVLDLALNAGGTGSVATPIVQAREAGKEVGLKWTKDLPEPSLSGDTATYAEVLPGVDLTVRALPEGYTENLVVKTREAAQNPGLRDIPFGLHTKNTTVSVAPGAGRATPTSGAQPSDGLEVKDDTGAVVFTGDASRMWDSSGAGSEAERQLGEGGGRREAVMGVTLSSDTVVISPDQAFLADPATRYPVTLDPDTLCSTCGMQAHAVVQSGYSDAHNYNASDGDLSDLKAGYETDDRAGTSRSYLQMNTAQIAGTVVHSASLNTTVTHTHNCSNAADTDLWLTGPFGGDITWAHQPGWSYYMSSVNVANCGNAPDVTGQFNATHAAQDAAAGRWPNVSLALVEDGEGGGVATWRRFALNPYLQVNYDSPPNLPTALSMQNGLLPCTSGANRPWVYTKNPQLAGKVSDPDGGTLLAKFAVAYGALGHNVYTHDNGANLVAVGTPGQNQQATAQLAAVPAGWINEDGIYNWSMQASDGELSSNWVGNCEFTVDSKVPAQPVVAMPSWTHPAVQGDPVEFSIWTGMATDNFYDIDHFIYTTDGSEPQVQGSPSVPATQSTDANGKMVAVGGIKATALSGNQNLIKIKSVNKAGMPSPDAQCVVLPESNPTLDPPSCSYHVQPLTPGKNLVAAWGADEPSGTALIDSASSTPDNATLPTHPATASGGVTRGVGYNHGTSWTHPDTGGYSDGVKGAITLDGTSGYAQTGDRVLDPSKSFTVAAWAKLADTTHSQTVIAQDGTQAMPFALQYNKENNAWAMRVTTGDSATPAAAWAFSSKPPQIGVWTHVAGTYDASTQVATLYVDGAKQSTVIAQPWAATGPAVLGATKWSGARADFFHGSLDDLQVWQRTLSGQDVHDLAGVAVPLANYGLAEGCGPELISATSRVPSLQASWALGQTSGNTAADSTGYGNTITLTGGYAWVPGHGGGGLQLDGATGYGSTSGPVVNTAESFTVSAWVNPTDLNAGYTVLSLAGSHAANFVLRYDKAANRWAFGMSPADDAAAAMTWATGTSVPQAGVWTLLTATFDSTASRLRLSVNGKHEADATAGAPWTANGPLLLGAEPGAKNLFKGVLDQGRVWSRDLTDDQIAAMNGLRYVDTAAQATAAASGGVSLTTETDGSGSPTGCAAQFDNTWTGRLVGPRPANLRTDKSFTVEGWVKHTWTAADVAASGQVDPATRTLISTDEAQFSPLFLSYRPYKDANGRDHGAWSLILTVPNAGGVFASTEYSDLDAVDNQWTHLAASYDAATKTMSLYVNGELQRGKFYTASGNATGVDVGASIGGLLMGSGIWTGQRTNNLNGGVAGVRVYSGLRGTAGINFDKRADDPGNLFGVTH
ncbi:LamG domain-containing protein [Amycolatopsis balhimycina]|uniref:LamG domain-containing protein n=1 Tax=Amycolatopsis balhimycina TaxID=208443 RepID=UPI001FDFD621|nr:LamG domain-containing protein [Amycolatopsis balhimycina]